MPSAHDCMETNGHGNKNIIRGGGGGGAKNNVHMEATSKLQVCMRVRETTVDACSTLTWGNGIFADF